MWRFVLIALAAAALLASSSSGGGTAPARAELAFSRAGDVWTIGADGGRARLLIRDAYAPAWSPDGSRIAFVSGRTGDEEIYVARADGSGTTRLTRLPGPDLSPAWSSDGRRLVWSRNAEIWTMSASGAAKKRLVARAQQWHEHWTPTWHGSTIVYASSRVSAFNTELFRVPAKRLTFTKGDDGTLGDDSMPDFSPDGRRIVFSSNRDQQAEIYVMRADGGGQRRLTRRPGDDWAPDFSPDGTRIAFSQHAATPAGGTVWVMDADGRGLRKLTAGTDPDWRPSR
jgi:Tol biopolymer transport system component